MTSCLIDDPIVNPVILLSCDLVILLQYLITP